MGCVLREGSNREIFYSSDNVGDTGIESRSGY